MDYNKNSSSSMLKLLGCLIFDFAIVLAYFKVFSLFALIAPGKSFAVLMVLLLSLAAFNVAILIPSKLCEKIGVPYSSSIITTLVMYSITANIFSLIFIGGNVVWYVVWELIIIAVYIFIIAIIGPFAGRAIQNNYNNQKEDEDKATITMMIMEIEQAFEEQQQQSSLSNCRNLFKALKDRIGASTPFGRIRGNAAILQIEDKIRYNLETLKNNLKEDISDTSLIQIEKLIEDTRKLVINRETLNVR